MQVRRGWTVADEKGDVEIAVAQLSEEPGRSGAGGAQVHHHLWMSGVEVGQQGRYVDEADRRQSSHRHGAAHSTERGVDRVFGGAGGIEGFTGAWTQRLSRGGQGDARRVPDKQFRTEFPFEGLDRRGHSGLDDLQSHGGPGKALVIRDGEKVLEMAKLHPAIITISA